MLENVFNFDSDFTVLIFWFLKAQLKENVTLKNILLDIERLARYHIQPFCPEGREFEQANLQKFKCQGGCPGVC